MRLTLSQITEKTGGILYGDDMTVTELVTDSRSATDGCIFAAIKGERADGFDYIPSLDKKCKMSYLCDRRPDGIRNPCIVVPDVLKAIGDIACLHLSHCNAKRVAVTGSVGKTTTKDFISAALGASMRVHSVQGNRNNELGLPLTALGTSADDDAVVLEMGMRGRGQITYLCNIARPDVSVITNIGLSHIELLGSRESILKAKLEIIDALPDDGCAVINADDDMLKTAVINRKVLRFGIENAYCDIRAVDIADNSFILCCPSGRYPVTLAVDGRHNIYNALAATAVGIALGCKTPDLIRGIEGYTGEHGLRRVTEVNGIRIIDDAYNASPASMSASMSVLKKYEGRHILVLADMLELGDYSKTAHASLAPMVRDCGGNPVICIGTEIKALYDLLEDTEKYLLDNNTDALKLLLKTVSEGDSVLFKGSHGMELSRLANALVKRLSEKGTIR